MKHISVPVVRTAPMGFSDVLLMGCLAPDGGLMLPEHPNIDVRP